jgi:hypothetical protein
MAISPGGDRPATQRSDGTDTGSSPKWGAINGEDGSLLKEPLRLEGVLRCFQSFDITPVIGTEFPDAKVTDWMKAANSEELLRDLAITGKLFHSIFSVKRG